jgi:hypothetical protein
MKSKWVEKLKTSFFITTDKLIGACEQQNIIPLLKSRQENKVLPFRWE